MKSLKEKALNKMLLGLGVKLVPLIILGLSLERFPEFFKNPSDNYFLDVLILLSFLFGVISFVVGYVIFIKACFLYTKSKGYSSGWGWLGIFSLYILPIFLLIPSKKDTIAVQLENSENDPFEHTNILEISLSLWIAIPLLLFIIYSVFFSFEDFTESILTQTIIGIIYSFIFFITFFAKIKERSFNLNEIIGRNNPIELKLTLMITIMAFAFSIGLSSLTLYQLSFIFPKYVEHEINNRSYTNLLEMALWMFSIIFLAPLIEEFFFRGLVLQKWGIKWGIKTAIIASSLFFALIHFRFDIISLFIIGMILSILYFKTRNLISPIIFHIFYNTLVSVYSVISFFRTPENERNAFISLESYQEYAKSLLSQRFFLIAVSVPFLIYFIYKHFPKNDAVIPYYANSAKIHETE